MGAAALAGWTAWKVDRFARCRLPDGLWVMVWPGRDGARIQMAVVDAGYFAALRIPILSGRAIEASENDDRGRSGSGRAESGSKHKTS